jgi:kynurenine formamidase
MNMNQTWHLGRLVELGLELGNDGWQMPVPLPQFVLKEFDLRPFCEATGAADLTYTQEVSMCVQAGTYLETGAHMFPGEMPDISRIGLDRLFLSAVVLRTPKGRHEMITASDLRDALRRSGETIRRGDAVLVDTGFDIRVNLQDPDCSAHFSYDAIRWVVEQGASLLGSDASNWYDGKEQPSFFPMFMRSGVLLLAPMVNLGLIPLPRTNLIVMPLPLKGACASPARVVAVLPPGV